MVVGVFGVWFLVLRMSAVCSSAGRKASRWSSARVRISGAAYGGTMVGIRREFVGSRADLEAMNRAISLHGLRPVVDREFSFDEAPEAYRYYLKDTSFGKVVINVAV